MEATERDTGGSGERRSRRGSPIHSGPGPALPGTPTRDCSLPTGLGGMCHCGPSGGLPFMPVNAGRVCSGRLIHEATNSLEVVACDWRPRSRIGRDDLSAGIRRWLRYNPVAAPRRRATRCDRRRVAGQIGNLGNFAGIGNAGGVLAPLLMMGAALGGVEATFLPNEGAGFWPLVSMGAILAGTMRAPFTAILFALELTHDINVLLPLLVAAILAHATTVLLLKPSILTEKVARRGFHLTREYATDPLEVLFVREVVRTNLVVLPAGATVNELRDTDR